MIKLIVFSALLNTGELYALPPDSAKIEARKRGGKRNKEVTRIKKISTYEANGFISWDIVR